MALHHFGYHEPPLDPHDCPICAEAHEVQGEEIAIRAAEAANSGAPERTREEIEHLKANWYEDPCFDIEETPGFERHFEELYTFRMEVEAEQEAAYRQLALEKAEEVGFPGKVAVGEYALLQERKIEDLEGELDTLREEVGELCLTLGGRA